MSAAGFCRHGVPTACFCRWCTTGTEIDRTPTELSEAERAGRRDAFKRELGRCVAERDAERAARKARRS